MRNISLKPEIGLSQIKAEKRIDMLAMIQLEVTNE
jgi:hypothetical protein